MIDLQVGQVLSLRIRYNNSGDIANRRHPYLIMSIDEELNTVEIAQLDSLAGKEYKAMFKSNKVIYSDNPDEVVIDKDSYIQMDNTIKIEYNVGLLSFRRQEDKLSPEKLKDTLNAYKKYHQQHYIDENKQVYMDWEELTNLQ